jgi:hypothetical protein
MMSRVDPGIRHPINTGIKARADWVRDAARLTAFPGERGCYDPATQLINEPAATAKRVSVGCRLTTAVRCLSMHFSSLPSLASTKIGRTLASVKTTGHVTLKVALQYATEQYIIRQRF